MRKGVCLSNARRWQFRSKCIWSKWGHSAQLQLQLRLDSWHSSETWSEASHHIPNASEQSCFLQSGQTLSSCNCNCHQWPASLRLWGEGHIVVAFLNTPVGTSERTNCVFGFTYGGIISPGDIYSDRVWINPNISFGLARKPAQAFTQLLLKVSTTVMLVHCWLHSTHACNDQCHLLAQLTRQTSQKTTQNLSTMCSSEFNTNTNPSLIQIPVLCWLTVG